MCLEKMIEMMMYDVFMKVFLGICEEFCFVDYICVESILLDFVLNSRVVIEEIIIKKICSSYSNYRNYLEFGGVKLFYVIFVELRGLNDFDVVENDIFF